MRRDRSVIYALALVCVVLSGCSANGAVNTPSPLPIAKVAGGSARLASSVGTAAAYAAPSAAGGAATAAVGSAISGEGVLSGSLIGSAVGLVMRAGAGLD